MAAVVPPVMLVGAESQRQGAAAAEAISDREETCDGGCATLPPCSRYSVWAPSGHRPRQQDSGALFTGSSFSFLMMFVRRHTQGHTRPKCSKFPNYSWQADVK